MHTEIIGFSMLGHDIADVDDLRLRIVDRFFYAWREEVRDDARIQVSGTDDDIVRVSERLASPGIDGSSTDQKGIDDSQIPIMLRYIDVGFSHDLFSIFEYDSELYIIEGHGYDFATHIEHLGELLDALLEVSGYIGECRQEEITDGMSCHSVSCLESVLEELSDDARVF